MTSSAATAEMAMPLPRASLPLATSVCAFMVPGLALWLRSGYSWGALALLLLALGTLYRWPRQHFDRGTWALAAAVLAIGLVWLVQADAALGAARWDRFSKLALALPCLFYAVAFPPSVRALTLGLMAGCWGAGAMAMWEVYGQGLPRADGYTNAIQFGNLALLLGLLAGIHLLCFYQRLNVPLRLGLVLGIALAVQASVLSLTRGGWLALVVLPVLLLPLPWRRWPADSPMRRWDVWLALVALLAASLWLNHAQLAHRLDLLGSEVSAYQHAADASTSIGHRLEHWRLAWHLGLERPWLGWGDAGYVLRKQQLVEAGLFSAWTTGFGHAHNELLDMFAKRGLLGVLVLMAWYAVPLVLFWPSPARQRSWVAAGLPQSQRMQALALCLSGAAIVLMYVGFGWTQVFFAHNSGVMFYVFMLILCWAALHHAEQPLRKMRTPAAALAEP